MKEICIILLIVMFVLSNCNNPKSNLSVHQVQYNAALTDSFFFKNDWSYPSLTARADDGTFDNGYGEKISAKDTAHLYYTAAIVTLFDSLYTEDFFKENGGDYKIDYGNAFLEHDTLLLTFEDLTPSSYHNLQIKIINDTFSSTYLSGAPPIGNRYYNFEKQKLILQKKQYVKGDTIKGYLDFQARAPKFVHLKGYFKLLIEQ